MKKAWSFFEPTTKKPLRIGAAVLHPPRRNDQTFFAAFFQNRRSSFSVEPVA
jgi:hypothetical protein